VSVHRLFFAAAACALLAVLAAPVRAQGRPDCAEVLHQLDRVSGRPGAGVADPDEVAAKLGTDSVWVERCALSYGRRLRRKHPTPVRENPEDLTAKREEQEYEELSREERDAEGEKYFTEENDDGKIRDRMRGYEPDSSAEWQPFETHEWSPYVGHPWKPYLHDDDLPSP
jgi:hypothetical protein